jgi:hypothetical protein
VERKLHHCLKVESGKWKVESLTSDKVDSTVQDNNIDDAVVVVESKTFSIASERLYKSKINTDTVTIAAINTIPTTMLFLWTTERVKWSNWLRA